MLPVVKASAGICLPCNKRNGHSQCHKKESFLQALPKQHTQSTEPCVSIPMPEENIFFASFTYTAYTNHRTLCLHPDARRKNRFCKLYLHSIHKLQNLVAPSRCQKKLSFTLALPTQHTQTTEACVSIPMPDERIVFASFTCTEYTVYRLLCPNKDTRK
jgi:hypothetical protein